MDYRATVAALASAWCLQGCAGVTFYSDAALKTQTGIPIYAPKPYLLVARTGAKDKPVDVSVVYLNDPQRVFYADPRSGFGSANLTLALTNGQMTSFGQQTDTKVPELISSLGGLLTSAATASKTNAEASQTRASTLQNAVSSVAAGAVVVAIADQMQTSISSRSLAGLNADEPRTIASAEQALRAAGTALSNPANAAMAPKLLGDVKVQAEALSKLSTSNGSGAGRAGTLSMVGLWATQLRLLTDAPPQAAPQAAPDFELYEIAQGAGPATLRKVSP